MHIPQSMKSKKSILLMILVFFVVMAVSVSFLLTQQNSSREALLLKDAIAESEVLRLEGLKQAAKTIAAEEARMMEVVRVANEAKAAAEAAEKARLEAIAKAAAEAAKKPNPPKVVVKDPTYKLLYKYSGAQIFVYYSDVANVKSNYTGYVTYELEIYLKDNQLNIAIKNSDIIMFFPKTFYVTVYDKDDKVIYYYKP